MVHYLLIGKANHPYPLTLDYCGPQLIILLLGFMNPTIDFNDQPLLMTVKISNKKSTSTFILECEWVLSVEIFPKNLPVSNQCPKEFFSRSHTFP